MGCKLYSDITCSSPIVQSLLRNALYVKHHTFLKLTYSNYQIIKTSEDCFQNMKFFPNQTNFSSGPSQILILQHPIPVSSLLLSPSLSNFALENWNPSCSFLVLLPRPTLFNHMPTSIGYTKSYAKPSQSSLLLCHIQIIKPYKSQTHIHQKAKFLKAASLSKLNNMVNTNSISNTKCVEYSIKW